MKAQILSFRIFDLAPDLPYPDAIACHLPCFDKGDEHSNRQHNPRRDELSYPEHRDGLYSGNGTGHGPFDNGHNLYGRISGRSRVYWTQSTDCMIVRSES